MNIPLDRSDVELEFPVAERSAKCLATNPKMPAISTEILLLAKE